MALAALVAAACSEPMKQLQVTLLPSIPDAAYAKGVSAPFCGFAGETLVMAGGANFPDTPLLEGGSKRVYDSIWALSDGAWIHAGSLPDSSGTARIRSMESAIRSSVILSFPLIL